MRRLIQATFVAIVLLLAAKNAVAATPPGLIHYQGVLRDASDAPLSGSFDVVFRLYDAPAGGQQILVDSHTAGSGGQVVVSGGLFSAEIGGGTVTDGAGPGTYLSLSDAFRDHAGVYLEIVVSGETLVPRTRVLSSAYALNADRLDGVDAGDLAAAVHTHSGTDITTGTINNARLNTGPGNGLDADTVDGVHAAAFVLAGNNASLLHKAIRQGANLEWQSISQIRIKPGILGFPDGKVRETTSDLIWDFANGVGELGLDTGAEAADAWYYLYAVPNSLDDNSFTSVASVEPPSQSGGTGPTGFAVYRFLGSFRNDSVSNILEFFRSRDQILWSTTAQTWRYSCDGPQPSVSTWMTVDASGAMPITSRLVLLRGYYDTYCNAYFTFLVAPGAAPPSSGYVHWCSGKPQDRNICGTTIPTIDRKFSWYAGLGPGSNDGCQCTNFYFHGYAEDLEEF